MGNYTLEEVSEILMYYGSLKFILGMEIGYNKGIKNESFPAIESSETAERICDICIPVEIRDKLKESDAIVDQITSSVFLESSGLENKVNLFSPLHPNRPQRIKYNRNVDCFLKDGADDRNYKSCSGKSHSGNRKTYSKYHALLSYFHRLF